MCIVTLSSAWARSCQQSNAYFKGISLKRVPCGFSCIAQECVHWCSCSQSVKTVVHVSKHVLLNNFTNGWKFANLKIHVNLALYGILWVLMKAMFMNERAKQSICLAPKTSHSVSVKLHQQEIVPVDNDTEIGRFQFSLECCVAR